MATKLTLLDIAKIDAGDEALGLIEENENVAPELNVFPGEKVAGSSYEMTIRKVLPTGGFRNANEGIAGTASEFEVRETAMQIFDVPLIIDEAVMKGGKKSPEFYKAMEASGALEKAFQDIGKQVWYGKNASFANAKGFYGALDFYDSTNMVGDAGGSNKLSSCWLVRFGQQDAKIVSGNNTLFQVNPWFKQRVLDGSSNPYMAEVSNLLMWIGLQFSKSSVMYRIKKLGSDAGKGLTDALLGAAVSSFPVGKPPSAIFCTAYQLEKYRASKTPYHPQGDPAPNVSSFMGIPIYATNSISDAETAGL